MTEVLVRATALRWESDDFPGWLEVVIVDAAGSARRIIDKVPVLTVEELGASSNFPVETWLRGHYKGMQDGSPVVQLLDGVATTEGVDQLTVAAKDLRWL